MAADEQSDQWAPKAIIGLGIAAAALVALVSGLEPTGRPLADGFWLLLFGAVVGFAALQTPRLLLVLMGALVLVVDSTIGMAFAGLVSIAGLVDADHHGLWRRLPLPQTLRSATIAGVSAPLVVATLTSISDFAGTGSSAALAGGIAAAVVVLAVPRPVPRFLLPSMLGCLVASVPVVAVSVQGAHAVQDQVFAAQVHGDDAAAAFRSGDFARAETELSAFERSTAGAVRSLDSWRLAPVKFVPIASQNLATIEAILVSGHDVANAAGEVMAVARGTEDLFVDGAIAVDQVGAIVDAGELLRVDAEVLGETLIAERGPWIAPPLRNALDVAHVQLAPLVDQAEGATALSGLTNAILGAEHPRQYLVLFANPAEARDIGGHTGSTAVLRVTNGEISLIDTRRNGVLNYDSTTASVLTSELPVRYLEQRPWEFAQNYTGTPDLATISDTLHDIYPAVTGHKIDGVIYIDPIALDALIGLSGPITLDSVGRTFERGELATFLLRNQYAEYDPRGEREAVFAELGTAAFDALSRGDIDASPDDLERLSTVIVQGRLAFAPVDPDERAAMVALGVAGTITEQRPDADYLAVSHINSAPNKLDAYLHRTIGYDVSISGETLTATATISMENQAPAGLPDFAAGNTNDLTNGTNRMTLVVHTPHELVSWGGVDDEPELTRSFREFDRWRHERIVIIPQGETRAVTITLAGTAPSGSYELDIDAQPLIHADRVDVSVRTADGDTTAAIVLRHDTTITPS